MELLADLHIHSPYSRATSKDMNFRSLERGALAKGIDVMGTGDLTHPRWREEIRSSLIEEDGLYRLRDGGKIRFMITGEVCTSATIRGKASRIHHVIVLPSLEAAEELCETLGKYGSLDADGRPTLSMTGAGLVESVCDLGEDCMVIPAHIWTPWFSLFGARGGVDRIEDCYEDMTPHIYALETGLSSDPPMNWRVSALDRFTLVSNSDSHSPSPWRIGREANLIEVKGFGYSEIAGTIMHRKEKVVTVEVDPAYGKYHWTGHRNCNVSVPPKEALRLKGICPVCGKRMTKGVAERVEELADRPEGFTPRGAQRFMSILPLSEVIASVVGRDVFSKEVQERYWRIMKGFRNEMSVLLREPPDKLEDVCGSEVANTIIMNREGRLEIIPGYDGVYGKPKGKGTTEGKCMGDVGKERFLRKAGNLEDYI